MATPRAGRGRRTARAAGDRRTGYWDRARETMTPAARARYQARWLAALVEHAWRRAPGVRRRLEAAGLGPRDVRSAEALARLPVLRKSRLPELQQADPPFGGFCTVPVGRLRKVFVSPGPIFEPMGRERGAWHAEPALWASGFRPGDVVLDTFLYHLVPVAHELDEALNLIGCVVVPTGVGNTDTQVTVARALHATGYVGTPSFLLTILTRARELGLAPLALEVAHVGAEPLPEPLRAQLEEEFGVYTRQSFGTADVGLVAYECAEKAGMHLLEDVIVQVCDPETGAPLPPGQVGELVVTVNNRTYPMIRFGTGDLTALDEAPCPCGRTSARMLGWRGRVDELTKVRGMFIHPRQADEVAARAAGVARFQVVVGRTGHQDTLTFRAELAPGAEPAAVREALAAAIREVMKLRGEVELVPPGTIAEGARKIVDERTWS